MEINSQLKLFNDLSYYLEIPTLAYHLSELNFVTWCEDEMCGYSKHNFDLEILKYSITRDKQIKIYVELKGDYPKKILMFQEWYLRNYGICPRCGSKLEME